MVLNAFTVPIRVVNPSTKESIVAYCIFDTGFTGYLGLTSKIIEDLKLEKIGEGNAITISGNIEFANYVAGVELLDAQNQSLFKFSKSDAGTNSVEDNYLIPIQLFRLPLIGMRSLEQLNWMIVASKRILCVLM